MTRALLLLALAACHALPDLGTCGNGVVEAEHGEACDGDAGCTATCELRCSTSGAACPDGQTCAIDNVCRGPSGLFFPIGQSEIFDVKMAVTGDFDGDRVDDLVGVSGTEIAVRYGTTSGTPFADGFVQSIPSSHGVAALFDVDPSSIPSGESDLAIAIPTEGLAFLHSDTSTFYPQVGGLYPIPDDNKIRVVVTDEQPNPELGEVVVEVNRPNGGVFVPVRSEIVENGVVLLERKDLEPCGQNARMIDVTVTADRRSFFVVGRNDNFPNRFLVCIYRDLVKADDVLVNVAPPSSVVLANVDDDACAELVLTRPGTDGTDVEMVDATGAGCTLATTSVALGSVPVAGEELLAAGMIESTTGRDDLVFPSGVYVVGPGGLTRFASPSLDPWTAAAVVDLDRDGNLDVVATREREDVDVIRGGSEPENRFTADTTRFATAVTAGDFDGDGFGDAALVEGNSPNQQLSLLYGGAGGILGPARINSALGGTFGIGSIRRFRWGNSARATDALDDLLVLRATPNQSTRSGGVLIGDPTRVLTMPRFPTTRVTSLGALAMGTLDGAQVSAFAVRRTGTETSELTTLALGTDTPFATHPITGIEIDETRPPSLVRAAGGTLLGVFTRDPTDSDRAIARLLDPTGALCAGEVPSASILHPADLDGDGDEELVVNVLGRAARAFEVTGGESCALGEELFVDPLIGCDDLVRAGETLLTACVFGSRTEVFRVVDGVRELFPIGVTDGLPSAITLYVGDYNGDGVQDVAVATTRNGIVSVQLFGQCPAHDTRACRTGP